MDLNTLDSFLDENGIAYRYGGVSILFKECPSCGSKEWKVNLRVERDNEDDAILGRCMAGKCGKGYSSISYLIQMGLPREEVLHIHGKSPEVNFKRMLPSVASLEKEVKVYIPPEPMDVSHFFKFKDWPDHPAVAYATKRGLPKALWDRVMINADLNSVVFLCELNGHVIGYQERYVKPFNPKMKTKTSSGFKTSEFVMEFPNPGKKILVCEGPFTAVAAWVFGYYAVCTFGSAMGKVQLNRILDISIKEGQPIGVAIENDEAGSKAFKKVKQFLSWKNLPIFKVSSSAGDLNDALMQGVTPVEEDIDSNEQVVLPDNPFTNFI